LPENEKGQNGNFSILSSQVDLVGRIFEPVFRGYRGDRYAAGRIKLNHI